MLKRRGSTSSSSVTDKLYLAGGESNITSLKELKKYLRRVVDMRTAAIAVEAFGTSRFFDDFGLYMYM